MMRFALRTARLACLGALAIGLAGCESMPDWLGKTQKPPLPGERISVLSLQRSLAPDPSIADLDVRLPKPYRNVDWAQFGGHPSHSMHHLKIGENPSLAWRASVGAGMAEYERLLASPVVAEGKIFVFDSRGNVSAHRADNGDRIWRFSLIPPDEDPGGLGGGLAYANGVIYVATGYGRVHAMAAKTGEEQWVRSLGVPLRGAPTVEQRRVFVISYDNRLHALNADDGEVEWSHVGIAESAGLLGRASPAARGGIVVAPYSSGELYALRAANGQVAWVDSLTRSGRLTALADLNDIKGAPIIDRGRVYAISHAGRMVALDLRSGRRLWDQNIAGIQMPWIAGDFLFVLTVDSELLALSRNNGRIRWVFQLARFEDEEDREGPIHWSGPVLASDRLIAVSSEGVAVSVSPYNGELIGRIKLPDNVSIPPIIAGGSLYFLTDAGEILAYR